MRAAAQPGYDRFVIEFRDIVPGWSVAYTAQPTGEGGGPVKVEGSAFLKVSLPARAFDVSSGGQRAAEESARGLHPGLPILQQAAYGGEFEGHTSYVLGLARRVPFRVAKLSGPPRLVVDLGDSPDTDIGSGAGGGSVPTDSGGPVGSFSDEGDQAAGSGGGQIASLRVGTHPGYDRLVIEYRDITELPRYRLEYTSTPVTGPSGNQVELAGSTYLALTLPGSTANWLKQVPVADASAQGARPLLPVLREVKMVEDFEGVVTYAIGLSRRVPFRVGFQSGPPRLVVDLRN